MPFLGSSGPSSGDDEMDDVETLSSPHARSAQVVDFLPYPLYPGVLRSYLDIVARVRAHSSHKYEELLYARSKEKWDLLSAP